MNRYFLSLCGCMLAVSGAGAADRVADAGRFLQAGNYSAAVERLRPAAPFAREQAHERFLYATALAGAGERGQAIRLFESLIADFPDFPEPYNNLAALHAAEGRLDAARDVLDRGIRTDPRYAAVYDNLGTVHLEMARGSYAKALRVAEAPAAPNLRMLYAINGAPSAPVEVAPPVKPSQVVAAAPKKATADVPAAAVARAPASAPASVSAPAPANHGSAVIETLQAWAQAWGQRNVDRYLGFYANEFAPPQGLSRKAWVRQRRERLSAAGAIEVELESFNVVAVTANAATVDVVQRYASANYSDRTRKQFELVQRNGRWLIRAERTDEVLP